MSLPDQPAVRVTICNSGRCKLAKKKKHLEDIITRIADENNVQPGNLEGDGIDGTINGNRARICTTITCLEACRGEHIRDIPCARVSNNIREEWATTQGLEPLTTSNYISELGEWVYNLSRT